MILCFDVGGTFVKHGLFDGNGILIEKSKTATKCDTKENFLNQIKEIVVDYEKRVDLEALCFSFPGAIDGKNGVTVLSGAINPLKGEPFVALLKEKLEKDYPIFIENDGNCAALAEQYSGNGQGCDNFVVMTLGTGIGGGIILDGNLYPGGRFLAGEFGMTLLPTKTSEKEIIGKYAATSGLLRIYRKEMNYDDNVEVAGEDIFLEDTVEKQRTLLTWSEYVSMVIYNITVMVNPEKILIGGGVSKNPKLLPLVTKPLQDYMLWDYFGAKIGICKHQDDAGLIGAYYLAKRDK